MFFLLVPVCMARVFFSQLYRLDDTAERAMQQINSKEYVLPWKFDGREIIKIGISFSSTKRNIEN